VKARFAGDDDSYREAMMGFDDRDLVHLAEEAGFATVHVECHLDIAPDAWMQPVNPEVLLDTAPNPNAPTVREAISAALTDDEQSRFLAELDRALSRNDSVRRTAGAYLLATKSR